MWFFKTKLWVYSWFQKKYIDGWNINRALENRKLRVEKNNSKYLTKKDKRKKHFLKKLDCLLDSEYWYNCLYPLIINESIAYADGRFAIDVGGIIHPLIRWDSIFNGREIGNLYSFANNKEILHMVAEKIAKKHLEFDWWYDSGGVSDGIYKTYYLLCFRDKLDKRSLNTDMTDYIHVE